jgi:hypothetical protein
MTKAETVKLFAVIAASYPRDTAFAAADAQMVGVWAKMLAGVPYELAENAITAHVTTSQFPPSIAEIRQWAAKAIIGQVMSADDAWGIVLKAIRKYGTYEPREARELCGPEIWKAVLRLYPTWDQLCMSENGVADRAHFMRMWDSRTKREAELAVLPESLRPTIAGGNQAALPGGNQKCLSQ